MNDRDEPRGGMSPWVWGLPLFIVLVLLIATYFVMKGRERDMVQAANQRANFQRLAEVVNHYATTNDGALPESIGDPQLLIDTATGEQCVYRVIAPDGTRLVRDPLGDHLIAWSPAASYRGMRAVITNDLVVQFVPEGRIDLKSGRIVIDEGLTRVRKPTVTPRAGEGTADSPATEPDER